MSTTPRVPDWEALERSPEFRELIARKRRFVLPATVFFLAWYIGFVLLAGYAPEFMGEQLLVDGVTVGYALAFSQFVMVWVLSGWYLRKADRDFDPLEAQVRALAEADAGGTGPRTARFERGSEAAPTATTPEVRS